MCLWDFGTYPEFRSICYGYFGFSANPKHEFGKERLYYQIANLRKPTIGGSDQLVENWV